MNKRITTAYRGHCTYCGVPYIEYDDDLNCECFCNFVAEDRTLSDSSESRYDGLAKEQLLLKTEQVRQWKLENPNLIADLTASLKNEL